MIINTNDCIGANNFSEISKRFKITYKGEVDKYLGVMVQSKDYSSFTRFQPL